MSEPCLKKTCHLLRLLRRKSYFYKALFYSSTKITHWKHHVAMRASHNPVTYHQITADGKEPAVCAVLTKQLRSQSTEGQSPALVSGRSTQNRLSGSLPHLHSWKDHLIHYTPAMSCLLKLARSCLLKSLACSLSPRKKPQLH